MTAHPMGRMTMAAFAKYRQDLMAMVKADLIHPQEAYNQLAHRALRAIEAAPPRFTKENLMQIAYLTMTFRQWAKLQAQRPADPQPNEGVDTLERYGSSRESAVDAVLAVMAWYSEQIAAERRRRSPDEARIGELMTARFETRNDLDRARTADPEEAERVGHNYADRLKELTAKEAQS